MLILNFAIHSKGNYYVKGFFNTQGFWYTVICNICVICGKLKQNICMCIICLLHKKIRNVIFNANHKTANYLFSFEEYLRCVRRIFDSLHSFAGCNCIKHNPHLRAKLSDMHVSSYEKQQAIPCPRF
jgi:hypothetical protein